jgi:hypothetical protein
MTTPTPPKEPVQKLHEALANWRKQQLPAGVDQPSPMELRNVLAIRGHRLYELLADALNKDSTTARVYFKDILAGEEFEVLRSFFQRPKAWWYLDTLRAWLRDRFGAQIRVEGDPRYAGYYFEFVPVSVS